MKHRPQHWLQAPNVSWRWAGVAACLWAIVVGALTFTSVADFLETRVGRAFNFVARDFLGASPKISPRLKIFSIDDKTLTNGLESWVLGAEEWAGILTAMDARKPKGIFVDAIFGKMPGATAGVPANGQVNPIERISRLDTPIYSGAFLVNSEIKNREPLNLDKPWNSISQYFSNPGSGRKDMPEFPLFDPTKTPWRAYGPAVEVAPAFSRNGHIIQRDGRVFPFVRMSEEKLLPAMAMFAADQVVFDQNRLLVNGRVAALDQDNTLIVNFSPKEAYLKRSVSMLWVINQIKRGQPLDEIQEGDYVLILPQMFTGNTDFRLTPFGYMPGGFVHAALINSIITGDFLKVINLHWLMTAIACLIGAAIGKVFSARLFLPAMTMICVLSLATVALLFAGAGIYIGWVMPFFGFWGAGISVSVEKARAAERKTSSLRLALDGAVSPGELKNLMRNPEVLHLEAREQVVTLMFIDVVGFSLFAENMLPRLAFDNLKHILQRLGESIHAHGGVVDKTLGDGLLCYFGYSFDSARSGQNESDHAERAVKCAIQIQKENLQRNLEAAQVGDPVYPLRIGINTASCFLGDLGSNERIDFTVVGNGVNFAKRLEGACEMHSVMFGATTRDLISSLNLDADAITRRLIRIKHHSELIEAFEFDPFAATPDIRAAALEAFRKSANIERIDQRWPVHDPSRIQVRTNLGEASLVNFSHTGFSIRMERLVSKGAVLEMRLDADGGKMRERLAQRGIDTIDGEVRWGYESEQGYIHGVMLRNIGKDHADFVVQCLLDFAFSATQHRSETANSREGAA